MMDASFAPYRIAGAFLEEKIEQEGIANPTIGIICGSGLSGLSDALSGKIVTVKYSDIPGFPSQTTVKGHKGEIVFGMLNGVPTMCFRGRFHCYEGHDMKTVVLPVKVMRCLGIKIVIVTNAAGGLNPKNNVGDVLCINDHLAIPQLAGNNALVGPNDDELGPRFPATSDCYPTELRDAAMQASTELGMNFLKPSGTYCFVSGPMYESKAECRFLQLLGGDAVGMSTVPEIVAAHHCGMKTLCLSLITNKVVNGSDDGEPVATHEEVLTAVNERSKDIQALVKHIVAVMNRSILPNMPNPQKVSLVVPNEMEKNVIGVWPNSNRETSFNFPLFAACVGSTLLASFVFSKRTGKLIG